MKRLTESIKGKINLMIIAVLTLMIILNLVLSIGQIHRIKETISEQYARMYSYNIASSIHSHLIKEIALSEKMANSSALLNWIRSEYDSELKSIAKADYFTFIELMSSQDLFLAIDASKNLYYPHLSNNEVVLVPVAQVNPTKESDQWYWEARNSKQDYLLNVDEDRILKSYRVWINVPILYEGKPLGVIGTGLSFNDFISDTDFQNAETNSVSLIFNRHGEILLDSSSSNPFDSTLQSVFSVSADSQFKPLLNDFIDSMETQLQIKIRNDAYTYIALQRIENTDWFVGTLYSQNAFYNGNNLFVFLFSGISTILIILFVINWFIRRNFVKPFTQLKESINLKNLFWDESLYDFDRTDEFGELAHSIQLMSERLINTLPVGLVLVDQNFMIKYTNAYMSSLFGTQDKTEFDEIFSQHPELLFSSPTDYAALKHNLNHNEGISIYETQFMTLNHSVFWGEIHLHPISDSDHYVAIIVDIQSKKDYEALLIQRASHDSLTGLANRHLFEEVLRRELDRYYRYGNTFSLIVFDLDHFKAVNDTFGHIAGDEVLVRTAQIAKTLIRNTDLLVRWGGEEFAILLPETDISQAVIVAEKIRAAFEINYHDNVGVVTASFGVSEIQSGDQYSSFFDRADKALFNAKESGRNQISSEINPEFNTCKTSKDSWRSLLISGDRELDLQHQHLIDSVDRIINCATSGNYNFEKMQTTFDSLCIDFTSHTIYEENLMYKLNYFEDEIQHHHTIHQDLIKRLNSCSESLLNKPTEVIITLIQDVIINHMMIDDVSFFNFMKLKHNSLSKNE